MNKSSRPLLACKKQLGGSSSPDDLIDYTGEDVDSSHMGLV